MIVGPTILIYLLIGVGVAVALSVSQKPRTRAEYWFTVTTAVPFWPFYIPMLLANEQTIPVHKVTHEPPPPKDEMAVAIAQVDAELEAALNSLDGWASDVLSRERDRIHELRTAWTTQSERIREMDRLLQDPGASSPVDEIGTVMSSGTAERLRRSQQVRRQNFERLRQVRRRAYEDLMATLAWVRELVSMIHLAKFTGAPAARAEELVAQIAAAVEGLSELTWQDEPLESVADNT
jgi:hypothetical protein